MATATQFGENSGIWEIAEISQTPEGKALLRRSLTEVTEGAAFKSSHRSAQFLEYVVEHSAMGHTDQLKERLIGIELFGRIPSYDTGEDAIVRVTASDVRKRLAQHYSQAGSASEFRISLPSGKYVPELIRNPAFDITATTRAEMADLKFPQFVEAAATVGTPAVAPVEAQPLRDWRYWILPVLGVLMVVGSIVLVFGNRLLLAGSMQRTSAVGPPWVPLFDGSRPVLVVASDPDIKEIQRIAHTNISLSDYANERYIPANTTDLSPLGSTFMRQILRGDKISSYDGGIIAGLASLTPRSDYRLSVKGARSTRMQDLQTDGNLVFLGSPSSNPWTMMYAEYLDFRFAFDDKVQSEVIHNVHPKNGEAAVYTPTAVGFGTGVSFATISVVASPGHAGRVLIIAGANAEGTEAAGILVTNPARWDTVQQACRFSTASSKQSMQLLLQLGTMAGSADDVKVIACHSLTPVSQR
jgi:hypothetical protein